MTCKASLTVAANQLLSLIGRPEFNHSNPLEWRNSWIEQSKLHILKKFIEDFL
jgi:hypothetical protein